MVKLMVNKKFIVFMIIILFLTCCCSSAFLIWEDDDSTADSLYLDNYSSNCFNYSGEFYEYNVFFFDINNFSCPNNVDVVVSFYEGDKLVVADCDYDFKDEDSFEKGMVLNEYHANNDTESLSSEDLSNPSDSHNICGAIYTRNYSNISHVKIENINLNEDKTIFNTNKSFDNGAIKLINGEIYDIYANVSNVNSTKEDLDDLDELNNG